MKKTLKLLILLMSLALVIGALSVVAFAKDGEDETVNVSGDYEEEGISLEDALEGIFKDSEGMGEFVITLQGNCSLSEDLVIDEDCELDLTFDLNGYTLDLEDATCAFTVEGDNVLNVTGSGEIVFGSQLVVANGNAQFDVNGTGAGIKLTSTTNAINKVIANGTSEINFKNVNFSIDYDVVQDGSFNPSESVIMVNDGTKVTFENSQFVYTVDFFVGEGFREALDGNTGNNSWRNQQYYGLRNCYFATMNGASQLVLNNTYVKTPTSGVKFLGATGMDNAIAEGKYALVMNGSTLFCVNDSDATAEYNKFIGEKGSNLRLLLFEFGDGEISTADLYIKNSYTAATYRPINSRDSMAAQSDPVHAIYDGSTFELYQYTDVKAGYAANANGEGIFDNGPIYMTFKNNSAINLSGANLRPGGTSNNNLGDKLVKGTSVGNGEYCIDIEAGTKTSGSFTNCDIPANTSFKGDPTPTNYKTAFVLADNSADLGFVSYRRGVTGLANDGTLKVENLGAVDGYTNVSKIRTLSIEEITTNPSYDAATRTLATSNGNYVVSEDGKTFVHTPGGNGGSYFIYDLNYNFGTSHDDVSTIVFHIKFDAENPLTFVGGAYFWLHARYNQDKTPHMWSTDKITTAQNVMNAQVPGEWNEVAFVNDYTSGMAYVYMNGVEIGKKNIGGDYTERKGFYDGCWFCFGSNTYDGVASLYIDGAQSYGFEKKLPGNFDPKDYIPSHSEEYNKNTVTPSVDTSAFTVGNQVFDNINDALVYANSIGSFVTLNAPVEGANVAESGFVRTNGYDFAFDTFFEYEEVDEIVEFKSVETVNVSVYTGTAEDPTADPDKMFTVKVPVNTESLIIPGEFTANDLYENVSAYFEFVGWATTYVRPMDCDSYEEYVQKIEALEVITDFSTVGVETEDVTFYPVYAKIDSVAFITVDAVGNVVKYGASDDITAAIAKAGSGSTVRLFSDVKALTTYHGKNMGATDTHDEYHRNGGWRWIDLNGYELLIDVPNGGTWINMAGGRVGLKSSKPGGVLAQAAQTDGAPIFNSRSDGAILQVEDPNNYVTVKAYSFLTVCRWGSEPSSQRTPKAILNGGTYINLGNYGGNRGFIYSDMLGGWESLTANNCTFINAGLNCMIYTTSDDVHIYNNCTIININANARHIMSQQNADGRGQSTINFNNCAISGYNLAGYKAKVTGTTVATFLGLDMITESGKAVAYDSSVTMTWPAHLGDSYVITDDMGETLATITADVLDVKFAIYDAEAVTNYKWNGLAGGFWTANVVEGTDAAGLNDYATEWVNRSNTAALTALKLGVKTWKLEGTEFSADEKVALGLTGFGAFANVKLEEGFVLGVLVTPENYEFLSAESKALFTKVTLEGVDYYIASADRDVNEAFTAFTVEVDVEEEGCTYTTSYTVSVMDYLELVAAAEVREEMDKIVAYIGAYLNNAYAYFTTTDATEADLAALAAFVAANAPEAITAPEAPEAIDANGNLEIKLDLTATPAFLITSKVAGTVTFNGVTTNLVANETVRLEASVLDFDNALTFALEGDVTGNYCLANYAATIAAATEIEGLNEEQLTALKALVASFYDYVIYAENFR